MDLIKPLAVDELDGNEDDADIILPHHTLTVSTYRRVVVISYPYS